MTSLCNDKERPQSKGPCLFPVSHNASIYYRYCNITRKTHAVHSFWVARFK